MINKMGKVKMKEVTTATTTTTTTTNNDYVDNSYHLLLAYYLPNNFTRITIFNSDSHPEN